MVRQRQPRMLDGKDIFIGNEKSIPVIRPVSYRIEILWSNGKKEVIEDTIETPDRR
jgi:hypothetical protein